MRHKGYGVRGQIKCMSFSFLRIAMLVLCTAVIGTAGCVTSENSTNAQVQVGDDVLFGDNANGGIHYGDGTEEVWVTDADGNIRHTITDTDGKVYAYHVTPTGDMILDI